MSKHNYSQYSKKNQQTENVEETVETVAVSEIDETVAVIENATPEITLVEETVETVTLPETIIGVIANCGKLNVRMNPSANSGVVAILDVNSEVEINLEKSDDEWYSVCTATGLEGYCMRKFVEARL